MWWIVVLLAARAPDEPVPRPPATVDVAEGVSWVDVPEGACVRLDLYVPVIEPVGCRYPTGHLEVRRVGRTLEPLARPWRPTIGSGLCRAAVTYIAQTVSGPLPAGRWRVEPVRHLGRPASHRVVFKEVAEGAGRAQPLTTYPPEGWAVSARLVSCGD